MPSRIANAGLASAIDHLMTQVNPENVLGVRRVLLAEADRLHSVVQENSTAMSVKPTDGSATRMGEPGAGFWVGRCSDDPISGPAAISFNRKIGAVVENCKAYINDLYRATEMLADTARSYGISEDEIANSFRGPAQP